MIVIIGVMSGIGFVIVCKVVWCGVKFVLFVCNEEVLNMLCEEIC